MSSKLENTHSDWFKFDRNTGTATVHEMMTRAKRICVSMIKGKQVVFFSQVVKQARVPTAFLDRNTIHVFCFLKRVEISSKLRRPTLGRGKERSQ